MRISISGLMSRIPPEYRITAAAMIVSVAIGGVAAWGGITLGERHALAGLPHPAPAVTRYVTQVADAPYPVPGPVVTRYRPVPAVTVTHVIRIPGPTVTITVTQTVTTPATAGSPPVTKP